MCIKACDALAPSADCQSPLSLSKSVTEESYSKTGDIHDGSDDSDENGDSNDSEVIPDSSVLLSPNGTLLFTSKSTVCSLTAPHKNHSNSSDNDVVNNQKVSTSNHHQDDRYPWTKIPTEDRDGVILEEEYESAVICGNDLTPQGDADSNGFTARGWNHDAATVALRASRDCLQRMEMFVEELATCRKEEAACVTSAVDKLSGFREEMMLLQQESGSSSHYEMSNRRMGPILSQGTNISVAMEAMEEYYAHSAEGTLERWRMACSERHPSQPVSIELKELTNGKETNGKKENENPELIQGLLPKLRTATLKATSRTSEREHALFEIRSKFSEAETILQKQKDWASSRWNKVADEESNIDRLYAIKKMEQHEFYESQRRRRQHENALLDHPMDHEEDEAPLSEEVWEMVQGMANSMEDYGHTG